MVILLKESDIDNGLLWDDYIDWCKLFSPGQLFSARKLEECTKQELQNYYFKHGNGSLRPK